MCKTQVDIRDQEEWCLPSSTCGMWIQSGPWSGFYGNAFSGGERYNSSNDADSPNALELGFASI